MPTAPERDHPPPLDLSLNIRSRTRSLRSRPARQGRTHKRSHCTINGGDRGMAEGSSEGCAPYAHRQPASPIPTALSLSNLYTSTTYVNILVSTPWADVPLHHTYSIG